MHRFTLLTGAAAIGVNTISAAVSAAEITPIMLGNTVFVPFWFVVVLAAATIAVIALSLIRPTEEGLPLSIMGFFLSICTLIASFVSGEYLPPQIFTNTSTMGNITNTTQQIVIPWVIHENMLLLLFTAGLFVLALLFFLLRVFMHLGTVADDADDELQEMINTR